MEKVVVITGGNNGIGLNMAKALLEEGFLVAALDLSGENLAPAREKHPDRLLYVPCDVARPEDVHAAVEKIIARWDRIDILVNNACIALFKFFEERKMEETRREFEVNYFGYLNTIAAVLPHMKSGGGGIIHNMGSGVGITGFPGICGYASTKGAVEAMTRTLAMELKQYNISVNIMHPPLTNTRSASPLGVPAQAMDDPARVGRKLAGKILSTKPVIASDARTAAYLWMAHRFPTAIGNLFAELAEGANRRE